MSAEEAMEKIRVLLGKRLDAASILLTNALKEELSVAVPRVPDTEWDKSGRQTKPYRKFVRMTAEQRRRHGLPPGVSIKRAWLFGPKRVEATADAFRWYRTSSGKTVKVLRATPGAPPRKFEGRLRSGHTWEKLDTFSRRVGTNVKYARRHEKGDHPYFFKTVERVRDKIAKLLGGTGTVG